MAGKGNGGKGITRELANDRIQKLLEKVGGKSTPVKTPPALAASAAKKGGMRSTNTPPKIVAYAKRIIDKADSMEGKDYDWEQVVSEEIQRLREAGKLESKDVTPIKAEIERQLAGAGTSPASTPKPATTKRQSRQKTAEEIFRNKKVVVQFNPEEVADEVIRSFRGIDQADPSMTEDMLKGELGFRVNDRQLTREQAKAVDQIVREKLGIGKGGAQAAQTIPVSTTPEIPEVPNTAAAMIPGTPQAPTGAPTQSAQAEVGDFTSEQKAWLKSQGAGAPPPPPPEPGARLEAIADELLQKSTDPKLRAKDVPILKFTETELAKKVIAGELNMDETQAITASIRKKVKANPVWNTVRELNEPEVTPSGTKFDYEEWKANRAAILQQEMDEALAVRERIGTQGVTHRADKQSRAYAKAKGERTTIRPTPPPPRTQLFLPAPEPRVQEPRNWSAEREAQRRIKLNQVLEEGAAAERVAPRAVGLDEMVAGGRSRLSKLRGKLKMPGIGPLLEGAGYAYMAADLASTAPDIISSVTGQKRKWEREDWQRQLAFQKQSTVDQIRLQEAQWRLDRETEKRARALSIQNPNLAQLLMGLPETTDNEFAVGTKPNPKPLMEWARVEAQNNMPTQEQDEVSRAFAPETSALVGANP